MTCEENVRYDMPHRQKTSLREFSPDNTSDRRQSKTRLKIDERGSKIARNSNFDCRLSLFEQQMTIKNSVSNDFFYLRSSKVLTFSIAAYPVWIRSNTDPKIIKIMLKFLTQMSINFQLLSTEHKKFYTVISWNIKILRIVNFAIVFTRDQKTKALIRLRRYTGWSAYLLFAYIINFLTSGPCESSEFRYVCNDTLIKRNF